MRDGIEVSPRHWIIDVDGAQQHVVGATSAEHAHALYHEGISPPASTDDVVRERERRLAAGFSYDFGDGRGVHRLGTDEADMKGWDEVSKGASAAIALGMPEAPISIVTETGQVTVTAIEWQQIVAVATGLRQAIWHASFALQALRPIPGDYADDSRWPPG